jgi:hypothetical protein
MEMNPHLDPNGGLTDSFDEAKAAFRAAGASAFARKSRRDMLNLSISVDDPNRTLRPRRKPGPTLDRQNEPWAVAG